MYLAIGGRISYAPSVELIVGWTMHKMLPFCSGPILITSCLRIKDTRLSPRYIFVFWENLGTRLHVHIGACTSRVGKASHLIAICTKERSPHLPVTPAQLVRPGIGWNASCAMNHIFLAKKGRPRCYAMSSTVQDVFLPIPGLMRSFTSLSPALVLHVVKLEF